MHSRMRSLTLLSLAGMLALGLVALVWAIGPGSSEAEQDAMHNCPQAGNWAISVWDGADGTASVASCPQIPSARGTPWLPEVTRDGGKPL